MFAFRLPSHPGLPPQQHKPMHPFMRRPCLRVFKRNATGDDSKQQQQGPTVNRSEYSTIYSRPTQFSELLTDKVIQQYNHLLASGLTPEAAAAVMRTTEMITAGPLNRLWEEVDKVKEEVDKVKDKMETKFQEVQSQINHMTVSIGLLAVLVVLLSDYSKTTIVSYLFRMVLR